MTEQQADEIIHLLTEIRDGLARKPAQSPRAGSAKAKKGDDGPTVGDLVDDTGDWGDVKMPIGREQKGKRLRDVPVGFIEWMADNWQPKGYRNDDAIKACIAAVQEAQRNGDSSRRAPANDDPADDDLPF